MTLLNINISSERIFLFCRFRHTGKLERSSAQGIDTDDHTHFYFLSKKKYGQARINDFLYRVLHLREIITPLKFNAASRF